LRLVCRFNDGSGFNDQFHYFSSASREELLPIEEELKAWKAAVESDARRLARGEDVE
jgi:hypothetical protein